MFHVSLLERYHKGPSKRLAELGLELVDGTEEWEVEEILDHRVTRRGKKLRSEYLVQWAGYSLADD